MTYKTIVIAALIIFASAAQGKEVEHEFEYSSTNNFVVGEIVELKPNARKVIVKNSETGNKHEYQVADEVFITVKGQKARFKNLRVGDRMLFLHGPIERKKVITRIKVPETDLPLSKRDNQDEDEDE